VRSARWLARFQSLDWVERLSDSSLSHHHDEAHVFQSLDWVERLSDMYGCTMTVIHSLFQSLDWVERLSDRKSPGLEGTAAKCFNPSTGLSVFQTNGARIGGA